MNSSHYVNAVFILERAKDATSMIECIDYVVEELITYSDEESQQILVHLIPMMLEFFTSSGLSCALQLPS